MFFTSFSGVFFLIFFTSCFSQDLKCKDFHEGTFYGKNSGSVQIKFKIIRTGNSQIEELLEIPEELLEKKKDSESLIAYEVIKWIDSCTYRLKYDETKLELTENQKFINDNYGIINRITKIEGNCFYYVSTLNVNGQEQSMEGKLCKEINANLPTQ